MSKVAIVHDALPFVGGAEKVLEVLLEMFPRAPVYTLLYNRSRFRGTVFEHHDIRTSFIDRLPGVYRDHYRFVPLFPFAVEQFDLREYEVIVSSHYAVAHGVLTTPDQLHISYTHTPLRYAWQNYHSFVASLPWYQAWPARWVLHYLRLWDAAAAARVDHFVANSQWVAGCIRRAYRRRAEVVYPPVDVHRFEPLFPRQEYYITVSRLVERKKIALVVEAFSQLGYPLLVVGAGPEHDRLAERAAPNVQLLGWQPQERLAALLGRAKAFVHVAQDDFGISAVEAQAAGCPVLAFAGGGTPETILPGKTGLLFPQQSVAGIVAAVQAFEAQAAGFDAEEICRHAQRFSRERFRRALGEVIDACRAQSVNQRPRR